MTSIVQYGAMKGNLIDFAAMPLQQPLPLEDPATQVRWRGVRWWVCGLIFLATTINYVDRQIIGVLKPTLKHELGWNEIDYSNIVFWFQLAYAGGYLLAGRLMDVIGVRVGYAMSVALWSVAALLHSVARSVGAFSAARLGLGLAEGGNFPAAVKTVSEWFPKKERALATGLFNSGSNIGAIVTPLTMPWITVHWGWPAAFIISGSLGFLWLVAWLTLYRPPGEHPRLSSEELAYIRRDPPEPHVEVS
ncbi:MAG TPA: MFS transporter, partial [Tepidisphaeraceae bacterium]